MHCDLKPDNLVLDHAPDGTNVLRVIDFGISGRADSARGCATDRQTEGSPHHMAPEQLASSEQVDARADIWSLAILLFELLTDTVPFKADSIGALRYKVLSLAPPSLGPLRADLPPDLEGVVLRCLSKRAEDRFASVTELADALLPFAEEPAVESVRRVRRIPGDWDAQPIDLVRTNTTRAEVSTSDPVLLFRQARGGRHCRAEVGPATMPACLSPWRRSQGSNAVLGGLHHDDHAAV